MHLHVGHVPEDWRSDLQLVLTTKDQQSAAKDALPVSYERLPSMVEVGDEIFLGRYLVTGAEEASLFLEVNPADSIIGILETRDLPGAAPGHRRRGGVPVPGGNFFPFFAPLQACQIRCGVSPATCSTAAAGCRLAARF